MNFVNAAVIGLVTFFILLLGFWYAFEVRSDSEVALEDVRVTWDGPERVRVEGFIDNPRRSEATLQAADYTLSLAGEPVGVGSLAAPVPLPSRGRAPVNWTVEAPGFAARWWEAQAASQGRAELELEATLHVARGGGVDEVEAGWSSPLGDPTDALEGIDNCPQDVLCVSGSDAGWRGGRAAVVLELEAPEGSAALVQGGTARWMWSGREVASARVPRVLVAAGESEEVGVELDPSAQALAAWWSQAGGGCAPAELALDLTLEVEHDPQGGAPGGGPYGTEVSTLRWHLPKPWHMGSCPR